MNNLLDDEARGYSDRIVALQNEMLESGDVLKSLKIALKNTETAIKDLKNARLGEKLESANFQLQIAQNDIRDLKTQAIYERERATKEYEELLHDFRKQSFMCQEYAAENRNLEDQVAILKAELEASKNAKLITATNTEDEKEGKGRE